MNICDNIGNNGKHAKDCIRSIIKRLNNPDPHVIIQAITVSATVNQSFSVLIIYDFSYLTHASTIVAKVFI